MVDHGGFGPDTAGVEFLFNGGGVEVGLLASEWAAEYVERDDFFDEESLNSYVSL